MFGVRYAVMSWVGLTTALHVGEWEGDLGRDEEWGRCGGGILLICHLTYRL